MSEKPQEFWQEAESSGRVDMRRYIFQGSLILAALIGGSFFALWWSSSAVHFSASRVEQTTGPTWRVVGLVHDVRGAPVPWAEIADAPSGRPPFFHATADRFGAFELLTIAEPHRIQISAPGFKPAAAQIGRAWYMWMPKGSEHVNILLSLEL